MLQVWMHVGSRWWHMHGGLGVLWTGVCMTEENDGTGDGECGKEMWVMGTRPDGGIG